MVYWVRLLTWIRSSNVAPSNDALSYKKYVTCIPCFTSGLKCDGADRCSECIANYRKCQRAKCQDYKAGKCMRQSCTRAHEGDDRRYTNIIGVGHISKKAKVEKDGKKKKGPVGKKPPKRKGAGAMGILASDFLEPEE
jgi:hypothetical protein